MCVGNLLFDGGLSEDFFVYYAVIMDADQEVWTEIQVIK